MRAALLLALTAGMLGAVNPCGFALLPAYLSVLVAGDRSRPDGPRAIVAAVGRALRCTAALTAGYVAVFGTFGLLLAPLAGALQPRLPWLTVVLGIALAGMGGWLAAGRNLPMPGAGMRAPRLTGTAASTVLFGMAYAVASLGCAIGPFLAIVVSSLRAGSVAEGLALFVSYAAGMGLVIGVTAVAVALVRVSAVSRLRRAAAVVPRLGGVILVLTGAYVAYYGWYELRLARDLRTSGQDPVINVASDLQHRLAVVVGDLGAGWLAGLLAVLLLIGALAGLRSGRKAQLAGVGGVTVETAYRVSPLNRSDPQTLGGYRLTGRLGSGGMGVVFLGTAPDGRYVAIKLVHTTLADDGEFRRRFRSEVQRARQVPAFCTAEVLDADLDHEPPYLVVEYVDGPSLAEVVAERGPLTSSNLHSLAIGVATALTAIHGAGVIHRDLKPRNVLLAPGSPKVIDFGIARALEATSQHTNTDQMVGTVAYMSPERFDSAPGTALTAAADIFAWGCVVAYAGTGRTLFHGDSPPATAGRILTQPPYLDGLAEPLRGVVALTLAKNPADRPTANELLDLLLARVPERLPVVPVPALRVVPVPALPVVARPRRRGWAVLVAAALMLAGLATAVGLLGRPQGKDPLDAAPTADGGAAGSVVGTVSASPAAPSQSPSPSAPPSSAAPSPTPPKKPSPAAPKVPREPTGGRSVVQDPLNNPGLWLDSEIREQQANCFTRGTMRAARVDRGVYQCVGPDTQLAGDQSLAVTTTLESAGSCSAIWFRWNGERGGYLMTVCADAITIGVDMHDDKRVLGELPLATPIGLKKSTRVRLVVTDDVAQVFRDKIVGTVRLTEKELDTGQLVLGISVDSVSDQPPYTVTFANVDIRSFED